MKQKIILIAALTAIHLCAQPVVALAQGYGSSGYDDGDYTQASEAARRSARALENQAGSLQRLERIERDRYRDEDRRRRNEEVFSRSNRRFDR